MISLITSSKSFTTEQLDLLQRCYDKLRDSKGLSLLMHMIDRGTAFGYYQEVDGEVVYVAIVVRMQNKEGYSALECIVGGGKQGSKVDFNSQLDFLEFCCRHEGHDYLRLIGRNGWYRKYLKGMGFKVEKEFKNIDLKRCGIYSKEIK